jgi:hypothetical protein
MAGVEIPDLYRKCRILIDYGAVPSWAELGEKFGVKPATVKWWGQGSAVRARDSLPSQHLESLIDIVTDALPPDASPETIQGLVFGPASAFEEALRRRDPALLDHLLETEADRTSMQLILRSSETGLVEIDQPTMPQPKVTVGPGAWFRIECRSQRPVRHAVAIQNCRQIWGVVPIDIADDAHRMLAPGLNPAGEAIFMREKDLLGLNRFIVFQTEKPAPHAIGERMKLGIALDYPALATLIDFYRAQPEITRRLYLLEIRIGEDA